MADYRDYGYLSNGAQRNVSVDTVKYGQVYTATHEGGLRISLMNRSFISFSYGGKWIEDFNLIATIDGDRMSKDGYASFKDNTSTYNNLEGEQYWSTHYGNHTFEFQLSTDGIDERMLDEFLYWFHAGEARELVLAEHPNRAILARVSQPPHLSLIPFEQDVMFEISSIQYPTKTTLYKGDISLTLVSDQPHWYAIDNVLGIKENGRYIDQWYNANGVRENIFASKDALKILYEDGIPLGSMIDKSMLLGNGAFANNEDNIIASIWSMSELLDDWDTLGYGARIDAGYERGYNANNDPNKRHYHDYEGTKGIIAGAIIDASGNGIASLPQYDKDIPQLTSGYFFYCGTAPAFTEIRFTLTPVLDSDSYVVIPRNSHSPKSGTLINEYNTIIIESRTQQKLIFTTPNVFTSYNKAIDILRTYINPNYSWEDIHELARDEIRHTRVREWLNKVIDFGASQSSWTNNGVITDQASASTLVTYMSFFLCNTSDNPAPLPVTFTFNSETGLATGVFQYRKISSNLPSNANQWKTYGTTNNEIPTTEEDVGDMLRSNYIIIRDRNYVTSSGRVTQWTGTTEEGKLWSHRIRHDVETPLTRFQVLYKNMYL